MVEQSPYTKIILEAEDLWIAGELTAEKFLSLARAAAKVVTPSDSLEPFFIIGKDEWLRELGWI